MKETFITKTIKEIYIYKLKKDKLGFAKLGTCYVKINIQDFFNIINYPTVTIKHFTE